jgi:hypothetical protein
MTEYVVGGGPPPHATGIFAWYVTIEVDGVVELGSIDVMENCAS